MPKPPDFGDFVWGLAFLVAFERFDVGQAWAYADEAWTRYRERVGAPQKQPGRPHTKGVVKRGKK